jgi:hypothetical protein
MDAAPLPEPPDSGSDAAPACSALTCDDGKECTVDSCNDEGECEHIPREGSCTDDASSCTDDVCNSGLCTHPSNGSCPCDDSADCEDNNPCTDDSCTPERKCLNAANSAPCADDGKECTDDVCVATSCEHMARTGSCTDDGDRCSDDVCAGDACTHPDNGVCECRVDADCPDDGNVCTDESCNEQNECVRVNNVLPCASDNDACTCDVCSMGMCKHTEGSCGTVQAVVINNFNSSANFADKKTTPLLLPLSGDDSFDLANLEGDSVLFLAETTTGTLQMDVPSLTGLTKIVVELRATSTGTASMVELGVFNSATMAWVDRALSTVGTIPDNAFAKLEVPISAFAVDACEITKVRLDFNVTGGQRSWRIQGITAE